MKIIDKNGKIKVTTGSGGGSGTVTSVGLSLPSDIFDISGTPVTSAGTLAVTLDNQAANKFWGSPTGSVGEPSFRPIDRTDLPIDWLAGGDLTGTYPNPNVVAASQQFAFDGILTPSQLTGTYNNYNPTGFDTCDVLRISTSAGQKTLTGLGGGYKGRVVLLINLGSGSLLLSNNDSNSIDANRFDIFTNITITPSGEVFLWYDSTSSKWRIIGGIGIQNSGDIIGTFPSLSLTTVGMATAGTYGSSTVVPQITVDTKGRLTYVTGVTISDQGDGGAIVQVISTGTSSVITTTSLIPYDNSKPQNDEGVEVLICSITPTNSNHRLKFTATIQASHSVIAAITAALFQDTTANALDSAAIVVRAATDTTTITLVFTMIAGTTSSTTFKIRIGGSQAGTTTVNGQSGAALFDGTMFSSFIIEEIS